MRVNQFDIDVNVGESVVGETNPVYLYINAECYVQLCLLCYIVREVLLIGLSNLVLPIACIK